MLTLVRREVIVRIGDLDEQRAGGEAHITLVDLLVRRLGSHTGAEEGFYGIEQWTAPQEMASYATG